ncbi:MAG: hypothetical protein MHM6MM_004052 [Cercozoa sp. M6MM]
MGADTMPGIVKRVESVLFEERGPGRPADVAVALMSVLHSAADVQVTSKELVLILAALRRWLDKNTSDPVRTIALQLLAAALTEGSINCGSSVRADELVTRLMGAFRADLDDCTRVLTALMCNHGTQEVHLLLPVAVQLLRYGASGDGVMKHLQDVQRERCSATAEARFTMATRLFVMRQAQKMIELSAPVMAHRVIEAMEDANAPSWMLLPEIAAIVTTFVLGDYDEAVLRRALMHDRQETQLLPFVATMYISPHNDVDDLFAEPNVRFCLDKLRDEAAIWRVVVHTRSCWQRRVFRDSTTFRVTLMASAADPAAGAVLILRIMSALVFGSSLSTCRLADDSNVIKRPEYRIVKKRGSTVLVDLLFR